MSDLPTRGREARGFASKRFQIHLEGPAGSFARMRLLGQIPPEPLNHGLRSWKCVSAVTHCPSLCDPVDSPGSSVHGILQARIPECVAISFFRGSSQPRDQTHVSCMAGRFFTV